VVALALINLGAATVIVGAMGAPTWAPTWVGLVLVVAGVGAAVWAVILWRQYFAALRER
jgi:hypothetical protein